MTAWIPKQGDLVALDFDPQASYKKKDRRPALVVSKEAFNKGTGTAICCPISNADWKMPFHVSIAGRTSLTGFVMCEQVKSLDFRSRGVKLIEQAPRDVLEDVLSIIDASIF